MGRLAITLLVAGLLSAPATIAFAAVPQTGKFSFEDQIGGPAG
jgi:hypothetical protein